MLSIGCDFHSRFQQIAMLDPQTGEVIETCSNLLLGKEIRQISALSYVLSEMGSRKKGGATEALRHISTHSTQVRQLVRHRYKLVCLRTSIAC